MHHNWYQQSCLLRASKRKGDRKRRADTKSTVLGILGTGLNGAADTIWLLKGSGPYTVLWFYWGVVYGHNFMGYLVPKLMNKY